MLCVLKEKRINAKFLFKLAKCATETHYLLRQVLYGNECLLRTGFLSGLSAYKIAEKTLNIMFTRVALSRQQRKFFSIFMGLSTFTGFLNVKQLTNITILKLIAQLHGKKIPRIVEEQAMSASSNKP